VKTGEPINDGREMAREKIGEKNPPSRSH